MKHLIIYSNFHSLEDSNELRKVLLEYVSNFNKIVFYIPIYGRYICYKTFLVTCYIVEKGSLTVFEIKLQYKLVFTFCAGKFSVIFQEF